MPSESGTTQSTAAQARYVTDNNGAVKAELPTIAQRQVGHAWLKLYGHMVAHDPAYCAAALWRCMWLARYEPNTPGIQHLFKERVANG